MTRFFEIVELSNGDIALRRADEGDGEALVSIHFSEGVKDSLDEHHADIARVMIEAGVRRVSELSGVSVEQSGLFEVDASRQVH